MIEGTEIRFYAELFNYTSGLFEFSSKPLFAVDSNYLIKNLFENSFEPTGTIDFILTVATKANPNTQNHFIFRQISEGVYEKLTFEIINSPIFIGDLDGDRFIDILYYDEKTEVRKILNFKNNKINITDFELFFDNEPHCIENNKYISRRLDSEGSNAFIDVNGDCRNDLLLTSIDNEGNKVLEIWQGKTYNFTIKYCLGKEGVFNLNKNLGAFSLGDFNNDGYIDLIFPVLSSTNVEIFFNQFTPDFDWTANYCKSQNNNSSLKIIFDFSNTTSHKTLSLPGNDAHDKFFISPLSSTIVRTGSFNSEPSPGIIVIINSQDNKRVVKLYSSHLIQEIQNKTNSFLFALFESFNIPEALYASFFDFDDDGLLDIIIASESMDNKTIAYFNNYPQDSFFVKAQTMLQKGHFSSIEIGTQYRFISTNNDGSRRMNMAWQLIQTTNLALNLPYTFAGIGRSNNYIENFQVISTVLDEQEKDTEIYTPIIPNSQMIITKTNKEAVKWEIDLIVRPMEQLVILIIVITAILFALLIFIIILHVKDNIEDKKTENIAAWFDH